MTASAPRPARWRSTTLRLTVTPLLAAAFVAGCGSDEETETAYCVDAQNEVVDDDFCDQDRGGTAGFFIFYGGLALRGGPIRRGTVLTGGERIPSTDRARVAARGGFGGSARPGGVGRAVARGGGGGGGFSGGS